MRRPQLHRPHKDYFIPLYHHAGSQNARSQMLQPNAQSIYPTSLFFLFPLHDDADPSLKRAIATRSRFAAGQSDVWVWKRRCNVYSSNHDGYIS